MNLFHLSAGDLMIWGLVLHLIADWPLQNDWMAQNKMRRRRGPIRRISQSRITGSLWFDRHPAAYAHAGIHGVLLAFVFGWAAALIAVAHLIIDCRWIVVKWSELIGQTQPEPPAWVVRDPETCRLFLSDGAYGAPLVDVGMEVRFWTDQVFHIICIAIAAVLVTL